MANICCSPPDRVPASWFLRCPSLGKRSKIVAIRRASSLLGNLRAAAPRRRLSRTDKEANTSRPSGDRARPNCTICAGLEPVTGWPWNTISPPLGLTRPIRHLSRVDLPAPLAPTRATVWPWVMCMFSPKRA